MLLERLLLNASGVSQHLGFPRDFACEQTEQEQGGGRKPRARRRGTLARGWFAPSQDPKQRASPRSEGKRSRPTFPAPGSSRESQPGPGGTAKRQPRARQSAARLPASLYHLRFPKPRKNPKAITRLPEAWGRPFSPYKSVYSDLHQSTTQPLCCLALPPPFPYFFSRACSPSPSCLE